MLQWGECSCQPKKRGKVEKKKEKRRGLDYYDCGCVRTYVCKWGIVDDRYYVIQYAKKRDGDNNNNESASSLPPSLTLLYNSSFPRKIAVS